MQVTLNIRIGYVGHFWLLILNMQSSETSWTIILSGTPHLLTSHTGVVTLCFSQDFIQSCDRSHGSRPSWPRYCPVCLLAWCHLCRHPSLDCWIGCDIDSDERSLESFAFQISRSKFKLKIWVQACSKPRRANFKNWTMFRCFDMVRFPGLQSHLHYPDLQGGASLWNVASIP